MAGDANEEASAEIPSFTTREAMEMAAVSFYDILKEIQRDEQDHEEWFTKFILKMHLVVSKEDKADVRRRLQGIYGKICGIDALAREMGIHGTTQSQLTRTHACEIIEETESIGG